MEVEKNVRRINGNGKSIIRIKKREIWAVIVLAADSTILARVMEMCLIIASFVLSPNHGSRDLPKEVNPES